MSQLHNPAAAPNRHTRTQQQPTRGVFWRRTGFNCRAGRSFCSSALPTPRVWLPSVQRCARKPSLVPLEVNEPAATRQFVHGSVGAGAAELAAFYRLGVTCHVSWAIV